MEHPDGLKVQGRYVAHADLRVSPTFMPGTLKLTSCQDG